MSDQVRWFIFSPGRLEARTRTSFRVIAIEPWLAESALSTHSNSMSRYSLESCASNNKVKWPNGKAFAFTIVDDTENSTVENMKPVYDLPGSLGFLTTKTVWPLKPLNQNKCPNGTLEDHQSPRPARKPLLVS
jgi:hypothetical protein